MPPVTPNEVQGNAIHRLDGALTIYTVSGEHRKFLELLKGRKALRIDLGAVNECDCAGLQLLCALKKSARKSGREIEWLGCSEAVSRCATQAGFPATEFQAPKSTHS